MIENKLSVDILVTVTVTCSTPAHCLINEETLTFVHSYAFVEVHLITHILQRNRVP